MDETFFSSRLADLREAKGVSARDMSLSIGQSANYINKIENRKAFPSMTAFFYICDYLSVSPQEFFEVKNQNPTLLNETIAELKKLDRTALSAILRIVEVINAKK